MSKASRKYKAWSKELARALNRGGFNQKNKSSLKEYRKINRGANQGRKTIRRKNRDYDSDWEHRLRYYDEKGE